MYIKTEYYNVHDNKCYVKTNGQFAWNKNQSINSIIIADYSDKNVHDIILCD